MLNKLPPEIVNLIVGRFAISEWKPIKQVSKGWYNAVKPIFTYDEVHDRVYYQHCLIREIIRKDIYDKRASYDLRIDQATIDCSLCLRLRYAKGHYVAIEGGVRFYRTACDECWDQVEARYNERACITS